MLSDENRNGTQKTQVYMPSRGMNAQKSDLISDPDVGKAFEYYAQYPGVMQGSQEGKRAKLWGPHAHFGANISMKIFSGSAAPDGRILSSFNSTILDKTCYSNAELFVIICNFSVLS